MIANDESPNPPFLVVRHRTVQSGLPGVTKPDASALDISQDQHGKNLVVRASGDLDTFSVDQLTEHLDTAAKATTPPAAVLLDLTGITYLSSAGVATLVLHTRRCAELGRRLRVVADQPAVLRPIAMAGADDAVDIVPHSRRRHRNQLTPVGRRTRARRRRTSGGASPSCCASAPAPTTLLPCSPRPADASLSCLSRTRPNWAAVHRAASGAPGRSSTASSVSTQDCARPPGTSTDPAVRPGLRLLHTLTKEPPACV